MGSMDYYCRDQFATDEFIQDNKKFYDEYIEYRVHGYSQHQAFLKVFGADHWPSHQVGYARVEQMEHTDYYRDAFKARLEQVKIAELWDVKKSLNRLLETVRGPMVRDPTKLAAIKELNVLVGIVVIDENGKTKAGRTLQDFYDREGEESDAAQPKPEVPGSAP